MPEDESDDGLSRQDASQDDATSGQSSDSGASELSDGRAEHAEGKIIALLDYLASEASSASTGFFKSTASFYTEGTCLPTGPDEAMAEEGFTQRS